MKKNIFNKKWLVAGVFACAMAGFTSCEDFLTVLPTDQITEEDFWKTKNDLNNARAGAYLHMTKTGALEKVLLWGEVRSDNLSLNKMDNTTIMYYQDGILRPTESIFDWSTFYTGINYCNKVLERGQKMVDDKVDETLRDGDWKPIKAEMLALRALEYFYLVRAYRDVPYITTSISTDAEAREHLPKAVPGAQILGYLIHDLEDALNYAAVNYAGYGARENYIHFTRRSIKALLADMYLWRGCMLTKLQEKGDTIVNVNGDSIYTNAAANPIITDCFTKAKNYTSEILEDMSNEYKEYLETYALPAYEDGDYAPLVYNESSTLGGTDVVYLNLFGAQFSYESILEWPNDVEQKYNGTYTSYFYQNGSSKGPQTMVGNSKLLANKENVDKDGSLRGFSKTDARMLGTLLYDPASSQSSYPVIKHVASIIYVNDWEDMNEGAEVTLRNTDSQMDISWPVYRMSDIMLIKAEAIARLGSGLAEGFKLTNELFKRNNPALKATGTAGADTKLVSDRLMENYAEGKTKADLLKLVYDERQREFVGEGKRWFDLVRYAEATFGEGNKETAQMFDMMLGVTQTLKGRLGKLYSLYNPIYSEELKVNSNLVQNPVWDKYTK